MQRKTCRFGAAIAIILVALAGYVGSYLILTEKYSLHFLGSTYTGRICKYKWMTVAYFPLAAIEGTATGERIELNYPVHDPVRRVF